VSDHGQTPTNPADRATRDDLPDDDEGQGHYPDGVDVDLDHEPMFTDDDREDDDERARRAKVRRVVLIAFAVLVLLAVAVLGWAGWLVNSQKNTSLAVPDKIGTLSLDTSADAASSAEYLRDALSAEISVKKAIGAIYQENDDKNVLFFGGTALIWRTGSTLKTAFGLITDKQGAVTDLHDIDAGPLGGTMQCGTTKSDDGDLTVCGWSDHGSVAVAMFPDRTQAEAGPIFLQIRNAVEHR
jgi:hypothetical protein